MIKRKKWCKRMETLIAGSIGYWTADIIKRTFGDDHVVIVAAETVTAGGKQADLLSFFYYGRKIRVHFFQL